MSQPEPKAIRLGRGGTFYVRVPEGTDPNAAAEMVCRLSRKGNRYRRDYLAEFNGLLALKEDRIKSLEAVVDKLLAETKT